MSAPVNGPDDLIEGVLRSVAVVARALHVADARLEPTLEAVVSTAASVTGTEAGLALVLDGRLVPRATSGPAPHELDLVQQRLGAGPCMEAATRQHVVRVPDMAGDARWPEFSTEALNRDVHSMLCVPLPAHERLVGTLSLYAGKPGAFVDRDEQITAVFATLAGFTLADAQLAEQLRTALASRDVIGQAKGILMEREGIDADEAFATLVRWSQARNVKLVTLAQELAAGRGGASSPAAG